MATPVMASAASPLAFAAAGRFRAPLPAAAAPGGLVPRRHGALLVARAQQANKDDGTPNKAAAPAPATSFWDAMAFGGPAPERINGRLAMVGFVAALAVEAARGDGLLAQAGNGAGLAWFGYTAAVLSAASLVPLLQGDTAEGRSRGLMTADAELWNGRLAMLGLVALAVTEYLTGAPFVNV